MAQPYYAQKTELKIGSRKGETVFSLRAHYYGVISTKQVAAQIAEESSLTAADVMGVINRLVYFCQGHMALGYKIKLDGLGVFYNQLLTKNTVKTADEVNARLIRTIRPAFKPEHTVVNGARRYVLLPERTEVVKVNYKGEALEGGNTEPVEP
jgi:putative DNA-binding protein